MIVDTVSTFCDGTVSDRIKRLFVFLKKCFALRWRSSSSP